MGTSRSRGTLSSSLRSAAEAETTLRALCGTHPLLTIIKAFPAKAALHLVGGTVRDVLLGLEPADLDLATVFPPEQVRQHLEKAQIRVVETGIAHGTLMAVVDGTPVEITTFRSASARNSTAFSNSIEHDLKGRDFRINAIAWSIETGKLVDPQDGIKDLSDGILQCVGEPSERFNEDPLRIMRMLRFGPAQGRTVAENAIAAATQYVHTLQSISVERIQVELVHILTSPAPSAALRMMHAIGALKLLLPEALPSIGFEQNEFHTEDVFDHTLSVIERCPPEILLRLVALFHDLGKPATFSVGDDGRRHFYEHEVVSTELARRAMHRLKFSNDLTDQVATLVRTHMRTIECGPPGLRRLLRDVGELFEQWRQFKIADSPPVMSDADFGARLQTFDSMVIEERARVAALESRKLAISGSDLLDLGLKEGPMIGNVLKQLEESVIDDPSLNSRDTLLARARNILTTGRDSVPD